MKMKILQVIPYLNPKKGGDVNICCNYSKELVKRGHDVTILTTDFELDNDFSIELENHGIRVLPFRCCISIAYFFYSPSMRTWVRENLSNYELIHLHSYRSYQNNVIREYASRHSIPYVVQAHGSLCTFFQKKTLKEIYDRLWGSRILMGANQAIAITQTEASQYQSMHMDPRKITIIPNAIDIQSYGTLPKPGQFKQKYGIPPESKIIVYLGRIHSGKGLDLLVTAFKEVVETESDVKLVIMGPDDGYSKNIEDMSISMGLSNSVYFTGFTSEDEKKEGLVDADVFVTPSFWGFPVTFIEAMFCETPIITTDRADKIEWIPDVGYITKYNSSDLAKAIITVLTNNDVRERFVKNCQPMVIDQFSLTAVVDKLESVYEDIWSNKESRAMK
jgi:glycosyltransferase involved in cell wall biosynthesis